MWRKALCALLALGLLWGAPNCAHAALSEGALEEASPANYACASALLLEADSGQIVFAMNADEKRQVASVVKIMTILLTLEAVESGRASLDEPVVVSQNAAGMGGSQVLLDVGETQSVRLLLKSTIVGSANDAAVALAEHLYGSVGQFVRRMNERALELGMTNTCFVNATGLPASGQYTTARDVAHMSLELLRHPTYFEFSSVWLDELDHGDGRVTTLTNTNKLIRLYEGCDGVKTGSTDEAGYCVSASAKRGDMRLVAVVLGAHTGKERFAIAGEILDYGFANYRRYPVAQSGARVRGEMKVTGGAKVSVPLMLADDLTLLIEKGGEAKVELAPSLAESLEAPVAVGDAAGCVEVTLDGRLVAKVPVVAAEEVARLGFADSLLRVVRRWLFASED